MKAKETDDSIEIRGLGIFKAEYENGDFLCYMFPARFCGRSVELLIYPNKDSSPISEVQKDNLLQQFRKFEGSIDRILADLPHKLRQLSDVYNIDTSNLSDDELGNKLIWQNIKLMNEQGIECYTNHNKISDNWDIVLLFSKDLQLIDLHFDG